MKVKVRKVYFCDYCNKHSLRPLNKHEKHCTANPNRECRLCENWANLNLPEIIEKYKNSYEIKEVKSGGFLDDYPTLKVIWKNGEVKIEDILDDVETCPLCALTVLRCSGLNKWPIALKINLQEELKRYWDAKNQEEEERYY